MKLRDDLPDLPDNIKRLPVDKRGYPVPWFVQWIDGEPEFRAMDSHKLAAAVRESRCWVCGGALFRWRAYVIGPMCAVNRISSEPPSHLDCASFSARACPFLSRPHMTRREDELTDRLHSAGVSIKRNPGVMLMWVVTHPTALFRVPNGVLFDIGAPQRVEAFTEGRKATPDEIHASIVSGFPTLHRVALSEGADAVKGVIAGLRTAANVLGLDDDRLARECGV